MKNLPVGEIIERGGMAHTWALLDRIYRDMMHELQVLEEESGSREPLSASPRYRIGTRGS